MGSCHSKGSSTYSRGRSNMGKNSLEDEVKQFIFTPSKTDEIAKKVYDAANIKLSRSTITLKDENGKTKGLIRNLRRGDEDTPRMRNKLWEYQRKTGVDINAIGRENIYFDNKQVYIVLDKANEDFVVTNYKRSKPFEGKEGYVSFAEAFGSDIKHLKQRNSAYKKAEETGAIILKTK